VNPQEIDKVVCEWSMEFGVAMTEKAQEALVDRIAWTATKCLCKNGIRGLNCFDYHPVQIGSPSNHTPKG